MGNFASREVSRLTFLTTHTFLTHVNFSVIAIGGSKSSGRQVKVRKSPAPPDHSIKDRILSPSFSAQRKDRHQLFNLVLKLIALLASKFRLNNPSGFCCQPASDCLEFTLVVLETIIRGGDNSSEGTASSHPQFIHVSSSLGKLLKLWEDSFGGVAAPGLSLRLHFRHSLRCTSLTHSMDPFVGPNPPIPPSSGFVWTPVFFDNFADPNYTLSTNFRHPMGTSKWKWDALSNKEIWWEPSCSRIVPDITSQVSKPILRVCVFSNWFHRIDRIATKQTFGYGYYESRVRFQGASGMHSAFWLLPEAMKDDPVAPGLILGGVEIDVVENRKVDGGGNDLSKQGNTAVHWGGYGANHKSVGFKVMGLPGGDPSMWATFGVWHFEGGMKWYWNGKEVNSANVWSPMRNSFYFSTEVGESTGWAGVDLGSYGELEKPEGFIDIDYCGFWEQVPEAKVEDRICQVKDEASRSKVEACGLKDEA